MKIKDKYTLYELFDSLPIPLTELSRLTGKAHGTLTRIRDGEPARKSTINKLLIVLSDIYKLDLSTENVEGIVLEGRQQKPPRIDARPSDSTIPISSTTQEEKPQISIAEPKRGYVRRKDTGLPEGCMLALEFGREHGLARSTFLGHMDRGLGKELILYSEREKPSRPNEQERYLTPSQQVDALQFWKRHGVKYSQCEREDCPCH